MQPHALTLTCKASFQAGAVYTKYAPDAPEFKRLMSAFVKRDLENLLQVTLTIEY
jgi:hypothetical protein